MLKDITHIKNSNCSCSDDSVSFVKRLTDKQIRNFLDELYPRSKRFSYSYSYSINSLTKEAYVHVSVEHSLNDYSSSYYFADYDSNISDPAKWIRYLHSVFGEEYYKAYLAHCANIFDEE
jgi:hypothetical protein